MKITVDPEIIPELLAASDRADFLCENPVQCQCGTYQVQIISFAVPAKWKCRICKRAFECEPTPR